jgi:hypothetical protein
MAKLALIGTEEHREDPASATPERETTRKVRVGSSQETEDR